MPIKGLLLDLGNVLVRLKDREFLRRMKRACPGVSLLEFDASLARPDSPHLDYELGRIGVREFHARLRQGLGLEWGLQEFCDNWTAFFTPNRPMELAAQSLKPVLKVWLISNTNAEHWEAYKRRFASAAILDGAVLSHEAGLRKPDPAIFKLALERMECRPEEVIYADDLEANVESARKLGVNAFHYRFNDAAFQKYVESLGVKPRWIPGRKLRPQVMVQA